MNLEDIAHHLIVKLKAHPKHFNSTKMGNRQFYWGLCLHCQSSLLRSESFYDSYLKSDSHYKNKPIYMYQGDKESCLKIYKGNDILKSSD